MAPEGASCYWLKTLSCTPCFTCFVFFFFSVWLRTSTSRGSFANHKPCWGIALMPWGDFLRLIFIHSIIIIIKIIIDSNTAVITEFHSALQLIIKCQFIPCCVTCFVNLCSRDIKSALLRGGVSSLPFYLFIFQNNSRGAFCGVKSRCMAASISRRRRPANKLELCSIWPQPMQRKQAAPPTSIILVTSSPGASFKGRGEGEVVSACNTLWGTNSSSPPLWSSSFDHLSNPGSAPPFAFCQNEGTRRKISQPARDAANAR